MTVKDEEAAAGPASAPGRPSRDGLKSQQENRFGKQLRGALEGRFGWTSKDELGATFDWQLK
jgi:hypothetical protein